MQHPLRNVIAATDFSAGAQAAVQRAAIQAAELKAELALVHVFERDSFAVLRDLVEPGRDLQPAMLEQARMQLEAVANATAAGFGLRPRTLLRQGAAVEELRVAADAADLLVVGACGGHPVREFTFGKTTDRLARMAARPLLVVRRAPELAYERVLVPVDFSENSRQALLAAMALAPRASIQLLHCIDLPYEGRMRMAGATDAEIAQFRVRARLHAAGQLRALVDDLRGEGRITAAIVRIGDVRFELMRLAQQERIDLIAIGKQGQSLIGQTLLGSVTAWTLEHAPCDVLVVPAAAVASRP